MLEIKDDFINKLVRKFSSKVILEKEGTFIAGGFAAMLYYISLQDNQFKKNLEKAIDLKIDTLYEFQHIKKMAGDIDYWVIEGTDAHKYWADVLPKTSKDSLEFRDLKKEYSNLQKRFNYTNDIIYLQKLSSYSLSFCTSQTSKECFLVKNHQLIRKFLYTNVVDVFENFDINLCKVAWYKGTLYVSEEAQKDFKNKTLSFALDLKSLKNAFQEVWSVMRLFKYYERYGFQPAKSDIEQVFLAIDTALDFSQQDKKALSAFKMLNIFGNLFSVKQNYDDTDEYNSDKMNTIENLTRYYKMLLDKAKFMFSFENFESGRAPYLLGRNSEVDKAIREYLETIPGRTQ